MSDYLIYFLFFGLCLGCNTQKTGLSGHPDRKNQNQPRQDSDSGYLFDLTELNARDVEYIPTDKQEVVEHDRRIEKFLALASFYAISESIKSQTIAQTQGLSLATTNDADHQRMMAERNALAYDFIEAIDPVTSRLDDTGPHRKSWEDHKARLKQEGWFVGTFEGKESDGTPDHPGLVFYHPVKKEMQVVFHGTRNGNMYGFPVDAGWSTNMENMPMTLKIASLSYTVHKGFGRKYKSYRDSMDTSIDQIILEAHGSLSEDARKQIFSALQVDVSGHSQGGASAQLATLHLAERMRIAKADGPSGDAAGASAGEGAGGAVFGYFISPPKTFFDAESAAQAERVVGAHRMVAAYHQDDIVTINGTSSTRRLDRTSVIPGQHIVQRRDILAYFAAAIFGYFHMSLPADVQREHPKPFEDTLWKTHFISKYRALNPGVLAFDPDLVSYADLQDSPQPPAPAGTKRQAPVTYVRR